MKKLLFAGLSALAFSTAFAGGPVKSKTKKQAPKQEQCCDKRTCCQKGQQPACCL